MRIATRPNLYRNTAGVATLGGYPKQSYEGKINMVS